MTDEQAERLIAAVEGIARMTQISAAMAEEQLGAISEIARHLGNIGEVMGVPQPTYAAPFKPWRGSAKPVRK